MNQKDTNVNIGTMIGCRYILVSLIGQGESTFDYLAKDRNSGGLVRIKIMKDDLMQDLDDIQYFTAEAKAVANFDHPNIVKNIGYGQEEDLPYVVQEYINGSTLKDLIKSRGGLNWRFAIPLAIQIGLAIEYAHHHQVVHKGIRPQNVLITSDLVAKVADFGLTRATGPNSITLENLTIDDSIYYLSPEQIQGNSVDETTDIYSLGILIYEMLTGRVPYDGPTPVTIAIKHLHEPPPLPSSICPDIPPSLNGIIMKCMQKSPDQRYKDVRELVDDLDSFLVEPNGIYGIVTDPTDHNNYTSAIGLNRNEPDYGKLHEFEHAIIVRRRLHRRDLGIAMGIVLIFILSLAIIGLWGWNKFQESMSEPTEEGFKIDDYIGRDLDDVRIQMKKTGIDLMVNYRKSNVLSGVIIDQIPSAGKLIKPGVDNVMIFYVSSGQEMIKIPAYAGQTATVAKAELEQIYGFQVTMQYEYSDIDKDQVIRTLPAAGWSVRKGSDVILYISDGPLSIDMPRLVGKTYQEARKLLEDLNVVIKLSSISGQKITVTNDLSYIIKQNPAPGKTIMVQSVVKLVCGTKLDYFQYFNPTPKPEPTPEPIPMPEPNTVPESTVAPIAEPTPASAN